MLSKPEFWLNLGPAEFMPEARTLAGQLGLGPCRFWTAATGGDGYGAFKGKRAHVLADEYAHGPAEAGWVVDHLCERKLCCEPTHLEAVTRGENTRRSVLSKGPTVRLNLQQVSELTGLDPATVGRLTEQRVIRSIGGHGERRRWKKTHVETWMSMRTPIEPKEEA